LWDGYGVIQAKFHLHPRDVAHNADWLKGELNAELKAWANPSSKRGRCPDYFLATTNVRLSPHPGTGGVDSVDALIARHAPAIGLKGWKVWHYDQLCRLLDTQDSVRHTFSGLITPGDVLARLHDYLRRDTDMLADVLIAHAGAELQADRFVRLEQAGDTTEQRLALHEVAMDLPAVIRHSGGSGNEEQRHIHVAAEVIRCGDRVLRTNSNTEHAKNGVVILGGPGQGKTTLAQLICQIYRVALLGDLPSHQLIETARSLCDAFRGTLLGELGLELPAVRRWPVHIRLDEYADARTKHGELPLLQYITRRVNKYAAVPVTDNGLADWLKDWPWLLVLDGLDEVADLRARDALRINIEVFQQFATHCNADLLTIVTTRPQGYAADEFSSATYEYIDIEPLDGEMALRYAKRLATTRYAGDVETQERVVSRIRGAIAEERTARLMRSPLQITIMSLLLARRSKAPRHRYELFKEYYETFFAREVSKETPDAKFLDRHAEHIHLLQETIGLMLQIRSEREGDAEAAMSSQEIRGYAKRLLLKEGFEADEVDVLSSKLVELAMRRLVLLVPRSGAGIGFEVRSLQEFMAARALVSGPETDVLHDLAALAQSAHWRNTWLLAAGRLFAERSHQRDALLGDLRMVDNLDQLSMCVMLGAQLAADLLDERVADASPKYQILLVEYALQILKRSPDLHILRLADILADVMAEDRNVARVVEATVTSMLRTGGIPTLSAMMLCAVWAGQTGILAGKARAWMTSTWVDLRDTGGKRWAAAVALVVNHPLSALREQIPVLPERGEQAHVADLLASQAAFEPLTPADRYLLDQALAVFSEADMWHESADGVDIIRTDQTSVPNLTRLDVLLTNGSVATAVKHILDCVDLPQWPIVSLINRVIETWIQRRTAGDRIVASDVISP
jgi:hypothetical protein